MNRFTEDQVRDLVNRRLKDSTLVEQAGEIKVSVAYLCDFLHGKRGAGKKLASGLGLRREVLYVEET